MTGWKCGQEDNDDGSGGYGGGGHFELSLSVVDRRKGGKRVMAKGGMNERFFILSSLSLSRAEFVSRIPRFTPWERSGSQLGHGSSFNRCSFLQHFLLPPNPSLRRSQSFLESLLILPCVAPRKGGRYL